MKGGIRTTVFLLIFGLSQPALARDDQREYMTTVVREKTYSKTSIQKPVPAPSSRLWSIDHSQNLSFEQNANSTYLRDTKNLPQKTIIDDLFDSKRIPQIQQQYQDMNRQYEMRRNFGLLTVQEQQAYQKRNQEFLDSLRNEAQKYQEKQGRAKLEGTREYKDFQQSAKENWYVGGPFGVAMLGYKIYANQDMGVRFLRNTWMESRFLARVDGKSMTDSKARKHQGKVSLENKAFGTSAMDYYHQARVSNAEDRYLLSHQRSIPVVDIGSSVRYGADTSLVTAEVSRPVPVIPHVTAVVDTTRAVNSPAFKPIQDRVQHTVQLKYGINF